jgi:hypothetical protein
MQMFNSFVARLTMAAMLFVLVISTASAMRVDKYPVSVSATKFTELYGSGNRIADIYNQAYYPYNPSYGYYTQFALPFNFTFDDKAYSAGSPLYCNTGSINFTYWSSISNYAWWAPIIDPSNYGWPATYMPNGVSIFSGLQAGSPTGQSGIYYQTTGSAPGRILTVEWYQMGNYYGSELGSASYEILLYETSNVIEFVYEKNSFAMTNSSYTPYYYKNIGLNGDLNPSFVQLAILNTDGTNKWYSTPSTNLRLGQPPINIQLSSSPKTIDMGSVVLGTSVNGSAVVSNVGDNKNGPAMLSIKSVSLTGDPDFSLVSYPASSDSLSVGSTRNIVVKFSPTFDGLRTAVLTISSNGKDSATQTIAIKGIGLAALISVDTNVLFKNKFTKMGTSMIGRILITSTGVPDLKIAGLNFKGIDAGEYSAVRVPSIIKGGQTDTLLIAYTPTKEGRHTASVDILNNSLNNPVLPITLWGTGVLPHIVVAPNPLLWDSIVVGMDTCKKIRISNPGTDTLLIKSNTLVSNDGDFIYSGLSGADTIIPPDKFKEVTVCFKPLSKGSRVARLRFTTNIIKTFEQVPRDTAGQFLIDIRGTGVPFGQMTQKIGNVEGAGWTAESIINTEICTKDTVWNNGDADILVSSMTISGAAKAAYKVSGNTLPFLIKAKSFAVVTICCTPTTQGQNTAQLTINGSSSEKPISSVATLNVKGLLVCATATPNPLFDKQLVVENTDSTICVDVTNCGDVPTSYTASIPSGDYSIDVTNNPNPSAVVAPGAKATFCIKFHPSVMGDIKTTLTVTPSTPELTPLAIPVTGIGACAQMAANTPAITGGAGGHSSFQITINNNGNYAWSAGTPTLTQSDNAYDVTGQTVTPDPIPANSNGTLTVKYDPTLTNHTYTGSITFPNATPSCSNSLKVDFTHTTGTEGVSKAVEQAGFTLGQNYPNPFGSVTTFSFTTPTEASIVLSISDLTGRQIKTITSGNVSAGDHTVQFDASDLSSGSYVITLESGSVKLARQIVVMK